MAGGQHVLCAYIMKPKSGYGYPETAAHFAAESSTGTNVEVSTTDDFTRGVDALVYEIDEEKEIMKIAHPSDLFDRNIIDGRASLASFLTLTIGNNQGMGDVEYAKMYDFWLGGDFIKNDEPQGNQVFARLKETITAVADAMRRAQDDTGQPKLFSANITADDYREMIARGEFILETFAEDADHVGTMSYGKMEGEKDDTNIAYMIERDCADPLEFAKDHREFARAFESFPADAERIYPGWRNAIDVAA
jgi:ribulose-bisphosphate carboxylase large chain